MYRSAKKTGVSVKKTFKEILKVLPEPKKVILDDPLPSVFDLFWDAKTFRDLIREGISPEMLRLLAQHGYDTTCLPSLPVEG